MYNKRITLEMYTVPDGSPGRSEATWAMREDGLLFKQNLILHAWDFELAHFDPWHFAMHSGGNVFYSKDIFDERWVRDIIYECTQRFNGTPSRRTSPWHDDASFGIIQRDDLLAHIEGLADSYSPLPRCADSEI